MFKGKRGLIAVVLLNIFIWGFCFYRFYSYNDADLPEIVTHELAIKSENLSDSNKYQLKLDYEDPFLKKEVKQKSSVKNNDPKINNNTAEPKVSIVKTPTISPLAPVVKYLGLVKNSTSGVATAIISINGQSKIVKVNETVEGIVIKGFDSNELLAIWGKEKMIVKK
jgi:hypothetical protein